MKTLDQIELRLGFAMEAVRNAMIDERIGKGTTTLDWLKHEYPWLQDHITEAEAAAYQRGVEAERAACAEVVRSIGGARWGDNENDDRERIAAAIEARGNPKT